jgi:hypothetical protein
MIKWFKSWFEPYKPKYKVGDVVYWPKSKNPERWDIEQSIKYKILEVGKERYLMSFGYEILTDYSIETVDNNFKEFKQ